MNSHDKQLIALIFLLFQKKGKSKGVKIPRRLNPVSSFILEKEVRAHNSLNLFYRIIFISYYPYSCREKYKEKTSCAHALSHFCIL